MRRRSVNTTSRPSALREQAITRKLSAWFEQNQRPLPWRAPGNESGQRCGWAALVAEAMLQQTQVARVVQMFEPFMLRFPRPVDLAGASEQEVLAMWQGLGYYRRARHLHQAATIIVERFGGNVPDDVNSLRELPGVGRYTAGAIASIVFGRGEPIVDGNVHRVLARLDANPSAADDRDGLAWTWSRAEALVRAAESPGQFNEALMELGSTVCLPRNPSCSACPLASHCKARRSKSQDRIPPAKKPPARKDVHHHAVIVRRDRASGEILFEQRPSGGLWAGLWQVPTVESDTPLPIDEIAARLRLNPRQMINGGSFEHQTSHRRVIFHVLTATSRRSRPGEWRRPENVADLPMSNAQRRILSEFLR